MLIYIKQIFLKIRFIYRLQKIIKSNHVFVIYTTNILHVNKSF